MKRNKTIIIAERSFRVYRLSQRSKMLNRLLPSHYGNTYHEDGRGGRRIYWGSFDSGFVKRKPNGGLKPFSVHAEASCRFALMRLLHVALLNPPTRIFTSTSGT
jgi:hypothetical protein